MAAALALAVGVAVVVTVYATRESCRWGTFVYRVPAKGELGHFDLAVLDEGEKTRVVFDDLSVVDAALSPEADRVVITGGPGGGTDPEDEGDGTLSLYTADIDGNGQEQLTDGPSDTNPQWSPDGETILFQRGRSLWTIGVDGRDQRRIFALPPSDDPDPDYLLDATWSGDSRSIAFFVGHIGPHDTSTLWTMRSDGSEREAILRARSAGGGLAWSPDGKTFAWHGHYDMVPMLFMSGKTAVRTRRVEPNVSYPIWSRDGARLAYVIGHEGHYPYRIAVAEPDASNPHRVPGTPEEPASFSLDDWASC